MAKRKDPGAPKVNVESVDALGRPIVQQIELDTNRPDLHIEFLFRFGNAIALPSRGLYTDAALWVLCVATPLRLVYSAMLLNIITGGVARAVLLLIFLPPIFGLLVVSTQVRSHRVSVLYRCFLIAVGILTAIS